MPINSQNKLVCSQSAWVLDAASNFLTRDDVAVASFCPDDVESYFPTDPGELQNFYTTAHSNTYNIYRGSGTPASWGLSWPRGGYTSLGSPGQGAIYSRRHTFSSVYSFSQPSGMVFPEAWDAWGDMVNTYSASAVGLPGPYEAYSYTTQSFPMGAPQLYAGDALWQTDVLASCAATYNLETSSSIFGLSRQLKNPVAPSYDGYDKYGVDLKLKNLDYSILPEFRISEFMEFYLLGSGSGDFLVPNPQEFEISGIGSQSSAIFGDPSASLWIPGAHNQATRVLANNIKNSSQDYFYKVFSNSDFMKQYKRIKDDHADFVDPTTITLTCKGLLKLLPYDGFYPSERTLQIARILSQSIENNINIYLENISTTTAVLMTSSVGVPGLAFLKRPFYSALYSPGILYNSIKAGIAVDFPVYTASFDIVQYEGQRLTGVAPPEPGAAYQSTGSFVFALGTGSRANWVNKITSGPVPTGGFDYRVPFEALLDPNAFLKDIGILDMEPSPDATYNYGYLPPNLSMPFPGTLEGVSREALTQQNVTNLWSSLRNIYDGQVSLDIYQRAINNFLAEVPEFFLENEEFSTLRSAPENQFKPVIEGNYYSMRVKLRRTMTAPRLWDTVLLGQRGNPIVSYDLPQDPIAFAGVYGKMFLPGTGSLASSRENFTLYSRPSAFGPPVAATGSFHGNVLGPWGPIAWLGVGTRPSDATTGFYCPYTPAYKDGEGWADIIFKAPRSGKPTLEELKNNCMINLWRIDTLEQADDNPVSYYTPAGVQANAWHTLGSAPYLQGTARQNGIWNGGRGAVQGKLYPLDAYFANMNAMQTDASINLFGVKDKRWVIQPKFETPHYNFNDQTSGQASPTFVKEDLPLAYGLLASGGFERPAFNTVAIPTQGSESVPRGMWHQFGNIESTKGVYLEVGDIPDIWISQRAPTLQTTNWPFDPSLERYGVPYNRGHNAYGTFTPIEYYGGPFTESNWPGSLADILDFKQSKKLGTTAKAKTISEAVVAVPFLVENGERKFFPIPENIIRLAMGDLGDTTAASAAVAAAEAAATATNIALQSSVNSDIITVANQASATATAAANAASDTLTTSEDQMPHQSIIDMVSKMRRYILPPRMDFVQHIGDIRPFAMYIFEFEYTLSACELSKIWQNVLPDIGERFISQEVSISHKLLANELMGNFKGTSQESMKDEVQWMVFKAKRRANNNYYSKIDKHASDSFKIKQYDYSYNWPYDYFSLIELAKIEAQVGFGTENNEVKTAEESDEYGNSIILNTGIQATRPLTRPIDKERSEINNLTNDELNQEQQEKRKEERQDRLAKGAFKGTKKK